MKYTPGQLKPTFKYGDTKPGQVVRNYDEELFLVTNGFMAFGSSEVHFEPSDKNNLVVCINLKSGRIYHFNVKDSCELIEDVE